MKTTLRIPTRDQFAFIELELDDMPEPSEVLRIYHEYMEAAKGNIGLPTKDFNAILDDLLEDQSIKGDPGSIEQMSPAQRYVINEVKKSFKRIN